MKFHNCPVRCPNRLGALIFNPNFHGDGSRLADCSLKKWHFSVVFTLFIREEGVKPTISVCCTQLPADSVGPFQKGCLSAIGISRAVSKTLRVLRSSTDNKLLSRRPLAVCHSRLRRVFCHPDADGAEYGCNKIGTPPVAA